MMYFLKKSIRRMAPRWVISWYHWGMAMLGALWYRFPSERLLVIGVTGTTGKSTTSLMITRIFEEAGYSVGMASTIFFKVGKKETLNNKKMTMLGRFQTQALLKKMVQEKCQVAIIETTSEGVVQFRHAGINYDAVVFTNLSPEHIESHGSFENYKCAKGKLFSHLVKGKKKRLPSFGSIHIAKTSVINLDDEHANYFLSFPVSRTYGFTTKEKTTCDLMADGCKNVVAEKIQVHPDSLKDFYTSFSIGNINFVLPILGKHNVYNALAAVSAALSLGIPLEISRAALEKITSIPGRLERIDEGQNFDVIVDYAFEPKALSALYETVASVQKKPSRIIHVAGQTGGGRDTARRKPTGEFIAKHADIFIVTNEDPYDEDPASIMEQVAQGARAAGMKEEKNLFLIRDRSEAIHKAISMAQRDDLVLITGKGSEQAMVVKGALVPWDDREVVRREIQKIMR